MLFLGIVQPGQRRSGERAPVVECGFVSVLGRHRPPGYRLLRGQAARQPVRAGCGSETFRSRRV